MSTKSSSKSSIIGLKDLRENMEVFIKRVNAGESITVYRRSTPLFKLSPVEEAEGEWETVIDFTKEIGGGMPADELLASIKAYGQKRKIS